MSLSTEPPKIYKTYYQCEHHPEAIGPALPCGLCQAEAWKKVKMDKAFTVGIPQSAKTFYHKASNGNVSIMRLATDFNWAQFAMKCNKCGVEKFLQEKNVNSIAIAIDPEIEAFCGEHQHTDWQEYKIKITSSSPPEKAQTEGAHSGVVTISKAEYLTLLGKVKRPTEEIEEGRVFRGEDE